MKDVQSETDDRGIYIDIVGVSNVSVPLKIKDKINGSQVVQASVSMFVDLPKEQRGTHFSRFVRLLHNDVMEYHIDSDSIPTILQHIKKDLESERSHIIVEFDYFITKKAPVSKLLNLLKIHCKFEGWSENGGSQILMTVVVPYTSLCPCSKEISESGAHNQRSFASVTLDTSNYNLWFEEVVELVEQASSSPIFNILKREDEKYVTELAYSNPRFVEDMVREISARLLEKSIDKFKIECRHEESIHQFDAFAKVIYGDWGDGTSNRSVKDE